jgi:hypothetical protein
MATVPNPTAALLSLMAWRKALREQLQTTRDLGMEVHPEDPVMFRWQTQTLRYYAGQIIAGEPAEWQKPPFDRWARR